jgi:hypothetical protein
VKTSENKKMSLRKKPGSDISPLGLLKHNCDGEVIFFLTSFYIGCLFQHNGALAFRKLKVPVVECRNVSNVKKN